MKCTDRIHGADENILIDVMRNEEVCYEDCALSDGK